MDSAIDILEEQFKWIRNNRAICQQFGEQSDVYYEGYKEGTKNCLDLLKQAKSPLGNERGTKIEP